MPTVLTNRRRLIVYSVILFTVHLVCASGQERASGTADSTDGAPLLHIQVWHGLKHRVGHLGDAQDDFNVLGHVYSKYPLTSFTWAVNGGEERSLDIFAYRRIAAYGDFNADIPTRNLRIGSNTITLKAVDNRHHATETVVTVTRVSSAEYPFPVKIRWSSVKNPESVGQYSDGRWEITPAGLRTTQIGYDRLFLIGNRRWKDYEIACKVTVHGMSLKNGLQSSVVRHVGFCMRWSGHSLEDNKPNDQPKWGLHPRGGIVWLTIRDGQLPPMRQFYRGDSERRETYEPFPISFGKAFWMKGRCESLPDERDGSGVTKYSFKVWDIGTDEPSNWDYEVSQSSSTALRTGGCALVAHELDVTFGDISVVDLSSCNAGKK